MDNPLRGLLLLLCATMLFSTSDAMAKLLGQSLPVVEIAWIRYITFVVMALALAKARGTGPLHTRLQVRNPALQILRGLALVSSALLFIFSLRYLELADASAIGFISPLLITMLSVPLLGEVVGIRRWSAIVVGLIGMLIVVRPGSGALQAGALFVFGSSASWALASVITRKIAGADDAAATLLWSAVVGTVVLTALLPFEFAVPSAAQLGLCLALGVIASSGQYFMVLAHRYAAASLLAVFSYSQLIWATAFGFFLFGAFPDQWTVVGAAIIVGSGLYTAHRERIRVRAGVAPVAPAAVRVLAA